MHVLSKIFKLFDVKWIANYLEMHKPLVRWFFVYCLFKYIANIFFISIRSQNKSCLRSWQTPVLLNVMSLIIFWKCHHTLLLCQIRRQKRVPVIKINYLQQICRLDQTINRELQIWNLCIFYSFISFWWNKRFCKSLFKIFFSN